MSMWLSMDTAPKDIFILLWCAEDRSRWLAKWQGDRWYGVDDMGLTREGHTAGDPEEVTGWAVNAWTFLPNPPPLADAKSAPTLEDILRCRWCNELHSGGPENCNKPEARVSHSQQAPRSVCSYCLRWDCIEHPDKTQIPLSGNDV